MSAPLILTACDAIEYATRWLEARRRGVSANQDSYRWAMHNAYMELGQEFDWSFLHVQGRVFLHEAQTAGTCTFDFTGGAYERLLTLAGTGATFPTWAEDATIRIDDVPCRIEEVKTTTTATLDAMLNPGRDVAAGSSYRMYPHYYALPNDFVKLDTPRAESFGWNMTERSYDEIMQLDRDYDESGTPIWYCIRGIEDLYGQMGLFIQPSSDDEKTLDFIYERRSREVRYTGWNPDDYAGTVTIVDGSDQATGVGTSFSAPMVGSIIRFGNSTTAKPTGLRGSQPYVEQRSIVGVTNTTKLVLDANVSNSLAGVKYTISDPIDIEPSLHNVFLHCMAKHLAFDRGIEEYPIAEAQDQQTLRKAKGADNRSTQPHYAGYGVRAFRRLADTSPYLGEV